MSSAVEVAQATSEQNRARWGLWLRQIGAIFRLEIEKNFLSRRSILIYLIALSPLIPLLLFAPFTPPGKEWRDFNNYSTVYSIIYNILILRKNIRREFRRLIATNQDLHRMLFHLVAHAVNVAFGNDVTVVQQHHAV